MVQTTKIPTRLHGVMCKKELLSDCILYCANMKDLDQTAKCTVHAGRGTLVRLHGVICKQGSLSYSYIAGPRSAIGRAPDS